MANNEFTIPIPARLKNVAKGGHVAGADQIIDDALGKEQSVVNQEVSEAIEGNTEAIAAERQRAEAAEGALNTRLSDVEELAEISIDGGEAKIATGEDFHNPTAEQRAKVTTVGAILDGADDEPTAGSDNLVKSRGVIKGINTILDNGIFTVDEAVGFLDSTAIIVNNDFRYIQQRVVPGATITIKANANDSCKYLQLKNKVTSSGAVDLANNIAGGMTGSFTILANNSRTFVAGNDCNYIIMMSRKLSTQKNYIPQEFIINGFDLKIPLENFFCKLQDEIDNNKENTDADILAYKKIVGNSDGMIPTLVNYNGFLDNDNITLIPSTTHKYIMVPVVGAKSLSLTAGSNSVYYGFLSSEVIVEASTIDLTEYLVDDTSIYTVNVNNSITKEIPINTEYILLQTSRLPIRLIIDGVDFTLQLYQNLIKLGLEAQKARDYSYFEHTIWGQWITPMVDTCNEYHDRTYFGWTNNKGEKGVAFVNNENGYGHSYTFGTSEIDDHSAVAVKVLASRYILCAWSAHNEEPVLHIRRSSVVEDIDNWLDEVLISVPANATYAQIIQTDAGKIFIFVRCAQARDWYYVTSNDNGNTWSEAIPFLRSSAQYYLIVRKTNVDGVFNFVCYANPGLTGNATEIRAGYWNSNTDKAYTVDGTEIVKKHNEDIPEAYRNDDPWGFWWWTQIPIIVPKEVDGSPIRNRLHDLAIADVGVIRLFYNTFPDDMSAELTSDSLKYYLYDNGVKTFIVDCGMPFYTPSRYTGGGNFNQANTNELYLSRKDSGYWTIEKYVINNGTISYERTIFKSNSLANVAIRPKLSVDGTVLGYNYGYFNINNFHDFDTKIKLIRLHSM